MTDETNTKRQLNFGFMLDNQNKHSGGFLIGTDNTSTPVDFDIPIQLKNYYKTLSINHLYKIKNLYNNDLND